MLSKLIWPGVVVVGVALGAMIPLLFDPTYYYVDDTQSGAFGQWYEIGTRVLSGEFSLVNPQVWQSGNYLAEGAWGVFSPLLWLIGIAAHAATDAAIFVTIVKLAFMIVAGLGVYLLAREFGSDRSWSAAIGIAAPLAGFTLYMDAPSWANGLMAWCLWPLAWALTRRAVLRGTSPLLAIVSYFCLVGIGYAHATLFLGLTLLATIIESALQKDRVRIIRSLGLSMIGGLMAVCVHLPGVLTAPVTGREGGVYNTGLLTVDLSGLAASSVPVGTPTLMVFGSDFPNAPLLYIAWFLPLLAFVDMRALGRLLQQRLSLVVVFGLAVVLVLLPSNVGPLRFPARMMPYLTVAVLVIVAVAVTHALRKPVTRRVFLLAAAFVVAASALTFAQGPQHVKAIAVCVPIVLVGLWLVYRFHSERGLPRWLGSAKVLRAVALPAVIAIGLTLVFLVPQHYAHRSSPLPDYGLPTAVADYQKQLAGAEGDVFVVGGVAKGRENPREWDETLVGNLWYVNGADVQNAYSAVYYPGYSGKTCMSYNGSTCKDIYKRLFQVQSDTGETLADLMGVSSVQSIKKVVPAAMWADVPDGWHIVEDTTVARLIVRDDPIPGAGGVVASSAGVDVEMVSSDNTGARFRVVENSEPGGSVTLSRIPWPGYQTSAGTLMEEPVDDFLLGVSLDGVAPGTVVTVEYRSPGYLVMIGAALLAALLAVVWTVLRAFGRTRGSRERSGFLASVARGSAERTPRVD